MYLVTGAAGFIGSNVAAALAETGCDVVACDEFGQDERWRNLAKHAIADIVTPAGLQSWLERHGTAVRAVVHMGAISSTTETNVELIVERNVRASLALLDWCTRAGKPLVYASSAATYGDGSQGFDDSNDSRDLARLRPLNAYGWSKHVVDRRIALLRERGAALPPQCVGLKFFNVYGPNEYHKGSMASVIAQNYARVRAGEPLRLFRSYHADYADGGQLRDFIFADDCVKVVQWLLSRPDVSGLFNVGTGNARSWLDLARALFDALSLPMRVEFIDMPAALRARYQYRTAANIERLRAAGYPDPMTGLETGVARYVHNYLMAADPYR